MYNYRINQFWVESDIVLPCDQEAEVSGVEEPVCQVRIRASNDGLDEFPHLSWMGRRLGGQMLRAYDVGTGVLICIDSSVRMFIERSGASIQLCFDATDALQRAQACASAINLGLSICTLLQDQIPLHGASLEMEDKFVSLVAPFGTGKSTLLWALLDQGARFACDDVTPVYCTGGSMLAIPSISLPAKLTAREITSRGLCKEDYPEALPGQAEYWIPIPCAERVLEPRSLSAIFVLHPFNGPELFGRIQVLRSQGAVALASLLDNTQGLWAVYGMLDAPAMLERYKQIATRVPIYTLRYHRHPGVVPHLAHLVRQVLKDGLLGLTDPEANRQLSLEQPESS